MLGYATLFRFGKARNSKTKLRNRSFGLRQLNRDCGSKVTKSKLAGAADRGISLQIASHFFGV
jgi:hypothetical protein